MLGFLGVLPSAALAEARDRGAEAHNPAASVKPLPAFPAPYINSNPILDEEIDGHRIFRPAGERRTIGHLLHFHGLGAFSRQEIEFLHRLASGKFQGEPVTVVAPMAQSLAPRDMSFNNLQSFYSLACFIRQQSPDVQDLMVKNFDSNVNFFAMRKIMRTVGNPPWWYPFVFAPASDRPTPMPEDAAPAEMEPSASTWRSRRLSTNHALKPDFDATIKLMLRTAEEIAPRVDAVLDRIGAIPKHICASGFSQGVGPAIIFCAVLRPGTFCRLVLMCASHVKTPNAPAVRDTELRIDVILPRGDPVLAATGFRAAKTRSDLEADFRGRSRIWEPPGGHAVEGHVAHIAGLQIVNSLRESYRKRIRGAAPETALTRG